MSDRIPTQRDCPACGRRNGAPPSCRLCKGAGMVDASAAARWEQERLQRLTAHFEVFVEEADRLIQLLDTRATESASLIANEGRALLAAAQPILGMPRGVPERQSAVTKLLAFNKQALIYLAGNR